MTMVLREIEVGGVDHICFGADWDGGGGLPGIEDISALPKVTERLKQAGYSAADLEKMWRGTVLRLLSAQGTGSGRGRPPSYFVLAGDAPSGPDLRRAFPPSPPDSPLLTSASRRVRTGPHT